MRRRSRRSAAALAVAALAVLAGCVSAYETSTISIEDWRNASDRDIRVEVALVANGSDDPTSSALWPIPAGASSGAREYHELECTEDLDHAVVSVYDAEEMDLVHRQRVDGVECRSWQTQWSLYVSPSFEVRLDPAT